MFLIKIYTCNKSEAWPRWCYGYCALGHTVQGKSQRDYCGSRLKWRSKGKYKNNSTADGWKKHINLQFSFAATILQLKLICIEFKIKQVTWSGNLCAQYIINTYFCNQGWLKEQKSNNIFTLTVVNMCPIEYYLTVCSTFFVHSYAWLSKIEKIQKILEIEFKSYCIMCCFNFSCRTSYFQAHDSNNFVPALKLARENGLKLALHIAEVSLNELFE